MSLIRFGNFFMKNSFKENVKILWLLDDEKWGHLIGKDHLGNEYYENKEERYGRSRWCLPAGPRGKQDPTQIPPGWNQWLHMVTDVIPEIDTPNYVWMPKKHVTNQTGTRKAYKVYNTMAPHTAAWNPTAAERH
ncbi:hypothetical protein BB559_000283 [Furculomyces boomerangus]|uniref:NADH dehydrogenase [ubiquinone] 1 alpha subcomplex subunit n=2 Tax=Harpellales TaxID=61421 RepID=A0A2T9Z5U7_9FUNG|nr:hypothetical protein BB559_000283 [Furculomyces boomerangus]PWA02030.1 hypothetical protein BB558_001834 [Smittium angustum]